MDPETLLELSRVAEAAHGSLEAAAADLFRLATDPFRGLDTDGVAAALFMVLDTKRCCGSNPDAASSCWRCLSASERTTAASTHR